MALAPRNWFDDDDSFANYLIAHGRDVPVPSVRRDVAVGTGRRRPVRLFARVRSTRKRLLPGNSWHKTKRGSWVQIRKSKVSHARWLNNRRAGLRRANVMYRQLPMSYFPC